MTMTPLSDSPAPMLPTQATTGTTSLDYCLRLARAYAVLTRRLDSRLSNLHGLSFSDFMVLYYLDRAGDAWLRRIDLAERLGMTASGVTRTLLPLEKIGLLAREVDPRDARVGYTTLTDAGKALFAHALVTAEVICQEAAQGMPDEHMALLSSVLGQMAGINSSND